MNWILIALIVLVIVVMLLFLFSACQISAECEREDERLFQEMLRKREAAEKEAEG